MPPVGFETTISAGERPKTYTLDRAATGNKKDITQIIEKFLRVEISVMCQGSCLYL